MEEDKIINQIIRIIDNEKYNINTKISKIILYYDNLKNIEDRIFFISIYEQYFKKSFFKINFNINENDIEIINQYNNYKNKKIEQIKKWTDDDNEI